MKDDSLSDVAHKYGFGDLYDKVAAKHPDSVGKQDGGYCRTCDTVWASPGRCRCDPLLAKHEPALNVYAKQIWNDALETAANNLAKWYPDNVSTNAFCAAIRSIRK